MQQSMLAVLGPVATKLNHRTCQISGESSIINTGRQTLVDRTESTLTGALLWDLMPDCSQYQECNLGPSPCAVSRTFCYT